MAEKLSIANSFALNLQWPANPGKGGDRLLDESIARFQMMLGDKSVTAYQTDSGDKSSALHVPVYFLTEWLAQNWWAFLYEPRKIDREDAEQDFRSRHWMGSPRNGFALPDVTFSSSGEKIEIVARPSYLRFAKLNFIEAVSGLVDTDIVRAQFTSFIDEVLGHMSAKGVTESAAHAAWERIKQTTKEQEPYCRLIGSLGLSPYVDHPEIDKAMENISERISERMLADLCEATNIGSFNRTAEIAGTISQVLANAKKVEIGLLLKAHKPDDASTRAFEWGYHATDVARDALGIKHDDPSGAATFFERFQLDPTAGMDSGADVGQFSVVSGAVARIDNEMQISIPGTNHAHRKFAAARASFLAWSDGKNASRLVTTARTRDQQASRAFAAELLAPAKFLKKRLGDRGEVSSFTLDKIADEIGAAPTVVRYQAQNHGYYVAEAA